MSKTILLADDSVTIQKVIELTFMDEDYEVVSASDGEQALDRLDEVDPDVVIADVHMPGASGFDVAKRSKQLHPHAPVLLLVGTFEPFDDADYEASGADAYLKKPFDSQELLQRVNGLLAAAPAGGGERSADDDDAGFTLEEDPSYGADEPLLTPEPDPAVVPPVQVSAPTESLLPPVEEAAGAADLGTRAVPVFGDREESSPVPPPPGARGRDADEEPFPELNAPAGGDRPAGDLFGSLDEADGSSQVMPPPDLLGEEPEEDGAPEAFEAGEGEEDPVAQQEAATLAVSPSVVASEAAVPAPKGASGADGTASSQAGLSDRDVDRIARRVAELLGTEALREVAWEVVPDLAEVVIKDRLRELESQVDEG